jgi:hypothetical protein
MGGCWFDLICDVVGGVRRGYSNSGCGGENSLWLQAVTAFASPDVVSPTVFLDFV